MRFKGERVLYEMALQDQAAAYASFEEQGYIYYQDAWYGMGQFCQWPLQRGVDCPAEALEETAGAVLKGVVLEARYLAAFGKRDIVCVFEDDASDTIWRHYSGSADDPPPRMAHNAPQSCQA